MCYAYILPCFMHFSDMYTTTRCDDTIEKTCAPINSAPTQGAGECVSPLQPHRPRHPTT